MSFNMRIASLGVCFFQFIVISVYAQFTSSSILKFSSKTIKDSLQYFSLTDSISFENWRKGREEHSDIKNFKSVNAEQNSFNDTFNYNYTMPEEKPDFWHSKGFRISVVPISLIAASGIVWGERENIREVRNRYIPTFRYRYDDYLQYAPAVAVFGLNAFGVKGKNKPHRALISYAFSTAIMAALVNGVKYTANVERPDGSARNSYPSGHTANAFMNATFLHKEYGQYRHPLYSVAAYTVATATGVGRGLNNRHWISDVLAGAGIGILSTELGYLITDAIYKERASNPPFRKKALPITNKPSFLEVQLGFATASSADLAKKADDVYAKNGFNLGIEGAWFFHKNFGIGGSFAFSSFPISSEYLTFDQPEINELSDGFYTQPMGVRYIHIGPFFSIPLKNNWFITAKLNAGSSVGAQGNVMLKVKDQYQQLYGNEFPLLQYKPDYTVSWSTGIGIQKRISRNMAIKAYGSYFDSNHDFGVNVLTAIENGKYTYEYAGSSKVKFNHFAFGIGVTVFIW